MEDVSGAETIVECYIINFKTTIFQRSKYYDSPTRVTRLKVESNMADPINIRHKDSTLKNWFDLLTGPEVFVQR